MSTVLLSRSHIASDHTVCHNTVPHTTMVDINHRKIFIAPDNKFIIATVGAFIPELVDVPETYDIFKKLINKIKAKDEKSNRDMMHILDEDINEYYLNVFDKDVKTIIVTKENRYVIYISQLTDLIVARHIGETFGIGAGGYLGAGMIVGGMLLEDVFPKINTYCHLSSAEHTIIALNILKDWE